MVSLSSGNPLAVLQRKLSSLHFRLLYLTASVRDRVLGVDLTAPMTREDAGIEAVPGTEYYVSTGFAPELSSALEFLKIGGSDSILDYGSGKGAALVKFSQYPFQKIRGVELSTALSEISKRNIAKLRLKNVDIVNADATTYRDLDTFNYFYLANPFTGEIFESVIANIIKSFDRTPRPVYIIYYHPKCHEQVVNTGRLHVLKEFKRGARKIIIYHFNE